MANKPLFWILALILLASCAKTPFSAFQYPESKVWAHGVNDTLIAQQKSQLFDGLELDVNYSEYQDQIFIGHELYDTINRLTLDSWFAAHPDPQRNCYWIDMKKLTQNNACRIATILLDIANRYGVREKMMVEHTDDKALKVLKDSGLYVILWVENSYWTQTPDDQWKQHTQQQIDFLHPDALSCEYRMHPLLTKSFPHQNIHYWDTPREYNDTNVAHTRKLLRERAVKVVLVDYPEPI